MAEVAGIICEYDPFHRGHGRQLALIRERLPHAAIVCVMSGCFTQRGAPALYAPGFRARAALDAGADLVLELPALFAMRDAEHFALGGVSVLHRLGFVTHISFGCENADLSLLRAAAIRLNQPDEAFTFALKNGLRQGLPFAAAQGQALAQALAGKGGSPGAEAVAALLEKPNNILAICYLRALARLESRVQPLPVLREGSYHGSTLDAPGYPSATAVRAALLRGERREAEEACGYTLPPEPLCLPTALDGVLLARLRQMSKEELAQLPYCSEGLENRLYRACREAVTRQGLLEALKSKRYTRARLSRMLCHALLGVTGKRLAATPEPPYARLLGFRKSGEALLGGLRESGIPIVAKAADGPLGDPAYSLDMAGYDLWALGAGVPAGLMLRQLVEIR